MGEVVVNELPSCVLKCDKAAKRGESSGVKRRQSVPKKFAVAAFSAGSSHAARWPGWPPDCA